MRRLTVGNQPVYNQLARLYNKLKTKCQFSTQTKETNCFELVIKKICVLKYQY